MGDLLTDLVNGRLQPVLTRGQVNGRVDYGDSDDDWDECVSRPDTYTSDLDLEQDEYVEKEMRSYFTEQKEDLNGLADVDDGCDSVVDTEVLDMVQLPRVFETYKFDTYYKKSLPIDSFKPKILDSINSNSVVIIHGPTGCGKTTQVPQYLLDQCKQTKSPCNIVVTQPRRIAAINIAQRVCEERGWALGTVCGYQVGLDKSVGDDVILTYVTTEVLLQKLISHKCLNRYSHVIIDEVHERTKSLDFLLLLVRKYLFTNSPSVKVILMSATMEATEFAQYFRSIPRNNPENHLPAPILNINKKSEYETNIYYIEQFAPMVLPKITFKFDDPWITTEQYQLCLKLIKIFDELDINEMRDIDNKIGSVLVFLPGFHEIEEMGKMLDANRDATITWEIIPLHSSLTTEHMVKVFQRPKPGCRKIILSTNIAESSVTVPDVKYVIDFCLTKIMTTSETTKFSTLCLQWASRNNCIQRAGRVGRVSNGRVYRLVPCAFYEYEMEETTLPELKRAPLENIILYMKLLDLNDTPKNVLALAISPPNLRDVEICVWQLKEVGALLQTCRGKKTSADGDITFLGRVMGSLPIDISMSKLIVLGHMFSCLEEAVIMAAGAMTRNIFVQKFHERFKCYRKKLLWADGSCSDLMTLLNLYNVWLNSKRQGSFRTTNEELIWCRTNFVNLKGLREWDLLIREINSRLKRFNIERAMGPTSLRLTLLEKHTILKIIICGAFYPNYFVRSSDYGQVDSREAVKILNGRDPYNTVYFTNMKTNQPGKIYVRQMKQLLQAENQDNVQIGFDGQSARVFVEFRNIKQPEQVTVEGREYITTIPGNISMDVYEAVRKRQLKVPFRLKILPERKAWDFVSLTEEKNKQLMDVQEDLNCFSAVEYSPLPTLDIEYITVVVTHVIDASHFYCQNWNDETRGLLSEIFSLLNGPGVFLDPVGPDEKVEMRNKIYAARFMEDGKLYRCIVLSVTPGAPSYAQVKFIDYGNTQKVPVCYLYKLPVNAGSCHVQPIAFCCVLSEVQPHLLLHPKGLWSDKVNNMFKKKTDKVLLNARVYSVVDETVHLELYSQKSGPSGVSINQFLIDQGHGQRCEESQRSKMDHEIRQKVLSSEDRTNLSKAYKALTTQENYVDFEAPGEAEATEEVELKGPFSPLEMKVCALVKAGVGASVHVESDSVNTVLLDDNPEDPHSRLLVAGTVTQSAVGQTLKLSQTTIMPSIAGLPMIMTLMFCPQMEPKLIPDGSRVASVLCGLGCQEFSQKSSFPNHDIDLSVDTELNEEMIMKINEVRFYMNRSIKTMRNIHDGLGYTDELFTYQKQLKENLFNLLHMKQDSVDRVIVKYADVWNKNVCPDVEILKVNTDREEPDDIWRLLWFIKLNSAERLRGGIRKNLEDMMQIARRLEPERPIVCELCESDPLTSISDIRIHLFRDEHKSNLAKFEKRQK